MGARIALALIALSASLALTLPAPPAMAESGIAGRWSGVVQQSDGQTYPAVMEFDGAGHGSSDYPSLDCAGKLSGSGSKGVYQFRETIAGSGRVGEGSGRCVDGAISVTVSGDAMHWSWSGEWQGKPIKAAGTLTREAGSGN